MIDTTANLVISKSNEVFLKINTEPHIEYELRDHFKFEVPNAKFMPQYRGRNWNGFTCTICGQNRSMLVC